MSNSFSILNLNVNGIRASLKKDLAHKIATLNDVRYFCLQEVRANESDCPDSFQKLNTELNIDIFLHRQGISVAQKKGYSGTAIYGVNDTNPRPLILEKYGNINDFWRHEGRCCGIETDDKIIISLYFPSGSNGDERQQQKLDFLEQLKSLLQELVLLPKPVILCGDWNIAHQNIDLKNWKGNIEKAGCTTIERDWFSDQLKNGWQDAFRFLYPDVEAYTWWSLRGQARANNVGWRIDYFWTNPAWQHTYKTINIEILRQWNVSDHAPLLATFERT